MSVIKAATIQTSDLEWIRIYVNSKKYTEAQSGKILDETGGDFCIGGPIFLWDRTDPKHPIPKSPCDHLKADGKTLCTPAYCVPLGGPSWNTPSDFGIQRLPAPTMDNYIQCVALVRDRKIVSPLNMGADMRGKSYRQAIGMKQGRIAYYASNVKYTPEEFAAVLIAAGWEWAELLDGGGSVTFRDRDGGAICCDQGRILYSYIVFKRKRIAPIVTPNQIKRERVLTVAAQEIGYKESPANSNRTKYGKWFGLDGYAWCMMFVQWVMSQSGLPLPIKTASCTALANYARSHGQWVTKDFMPGDILFMHWNKSSTTTEHTGIVKEVHSTYVVTIEGNTSLTSQDNGGCVMQRNRAMSVITGAYRPWYNK